MKRFAAFDIDGTIFRWQLYHELFDAFVDEGILAGEQSQQVLDARERWRNRELDYHDYEQTLMSVMEVVIVGLERERLHAIADRILESKGNHIYRYTLELLQRLKRDGYSIIAISASHHELVERFGKLHAIDICYGRKFETKDGKIINKSNVVHERKKAILEELVAEHDLSWEGSYAVGDSASDIGMLELVENPIAFNPNDELLAAAKTNGWPIVIERKSLAYRLEKDPDGHYVLA